MTLLLARIQRVPPALWSLLITLGVLGLLTLLNHTRWVRLDPDAVFLMTAGVAAFLGGRRAGLISAALIMGYAALFYATPGSPSSYLSDDVEELVPVLVAVPLVALLAGLLRRHAHRQLYDLRESTARIHAILESTADGIITFDTSGIIESFNPAAERIHGYTAAEMIGQSINLLRPLAADGTPSVPLMPLRRKIGGLEGRSQVGLARRKDGMTIPLAATLTLLSIEGHHLYVSVVSDISERVRTEEVLRRKAAFLELLQAVAVAANEAVTIEAGLQSVLTLFSEYLGWPAGHAYLPGSDGTDRRPALNLWHLDQTAAAARIRPATAAARLVSNLGLVADVFACEQPVWIPELAGDARARRRETATTYDIQTGFAFPIMMGAEVAGVLEFFAPVAQPPDMPLLDAAHSIGTQLGRLVERKRTEAALRASELRFSTIFHASPAAITVNRLSDRSFLDVNNSFLALLGYAREEIVGHTLEDLQLWPNVEDRARVARQLEAGHSVHDLEFPLLTKSGERRDMLSSMELIDLDGVPCVLVMAHDISERKRVEAALRESERQFRAVFDNALEAMVIFDDMARYTDANPAAAALFGEAREHLLHRVMGGAAVVGQEGAFQHVWRAFLAQGHLQGEFQIRRTDGAIRDIEFNGSANILPGQHLAVMQDITERKRTEAALRDSEERLRTVLNSAPIVLYAYDQQGVVTLAEGQGLASIGQQAGNDLGHSIFALEYLPQGLKESVRRALDGETFTTLLEGATAVFETRYAPMRDATGAVAGALSVAVDITERTRAEAALRESQERFAKVFHGSPVGIALARLPDGYIMEVNESYQRIFGYERDELIGHTAVELGIWEDPAVRIRAMAALQQHGTLRDVEMRLRRKSGEVREGLLSFELLEMNGESWLVALCSDITERKRMEAALQHERHLLQMLLENVPDSIYFKDTASRFTRINRALAERLGLGEPGEAVGYTDADFFTPEHADPAYADEQVVLRTGQPLIGKEEREIWATGQERWVITSKMPLRDDTGHTIGTFGVSTDITALKRAEAAQQEANEQLTGWMTSLQQHSHEMTRLNEMSELLQSCDTAEEAYTVVNQMAPRLFAGESGALYVLKTTPNFVEAVAVWGDLAGRDLVFSDDDCWALRRSQHHIVADTREGLVCRHVSTSERPASYICTPLMAHGETLGILHIRFGAHMALLDDGARTRLLESTGRLAASVAAQLGLALANLKLRETLHQQAIHDSLTGLYNRRYMEVSLERELRRAERNSTPLGVIMLDLDHFKRFNDTFGHAAGDTLLRELGTLLQTSIRAEDIACRYGGEEFILVLPNASLEKTRCRAEQLRQAAQGLEVTHHDQPLGPVTLSLGVAAYPEHSSTGAGILQAADAALYQAKGAGRDRVVVADVDGDAPIFGQFAGLAKGCRRG